MILLTNVFICHTFDICRRIFWDYTGFAFCMCEWWWPLVKARHVSLVSLGAAAISWLNGSNSSRWEVSNNSSHGATRTSRSTTAGMANLTLK